MNKNVYGLKNVLKPNVFFVASVHRGSQTDDKLARSVANGRAPTKNGNSSFLTLKTQLREHKPQIKRSAKSGGVECKQDRQCDSYWKEPKPIEESIPVQKRCIPLSFSQRIIKVKRMNSVHGTFIGASDNKKVNFVVFCS